MLGGFGASLFGRMTNAEVSASAHTAATGAEHGATAAATASQIILRDSSSRANVANPPGSDSSTLIANTNWVQGEIAGAGTVTNVATGTGLTGGPITSTGTISLANTAVTPASYTFASITVDQQGRLTLASNGTPVTTVTGSAPVVSSGGQTPAISMAAATASVNGYMTSTFANKLNGIDIGAETNDVDTVFGRSGTVVAVPNDYNITDIDGVTVSDSAPSGGATGDLWFEY